MIQSGGFLRNMLGNLGKKVTADFSVPLARDNLPGLVTSLASNTVDKLERKINGKGAVRTKTGFTLFISKQDMNDTTKIIKSLENWNVLTDVITETVKHKIKNTRRWIYSCLVSIFNHFISATNYFFSSKRYKWKRN